MALVDKFIRGMIGNVIFYERNGKQVARARARKVRRSPASKARSTNFGHASALSSVFINQFVWMMSLPKFPNLQQRFAGAISKWLGTEPVNEKASEKDIQWVKGFQLNTATEFHQLFRIPIELGGQAGEPLSLSIPAFVPTGMIQAPPYTATVVCSLAAVSCSLKDKEVMQLDKKILEIPYNNERFPAEEFDLKVSIKPGELIVIVASLLYKGKLSHTFDGVQELKWRPAEVVGAIYNSGAELTP